MRQPWGPNYNEKADDRKKRLETLQGFLGSKLCKSTYNFKCYIFKANWSLKAKFLKWMLENDSNHIWRQAYAISNKII